MDNEPIAGLLIRTSLVEDLAFKQLSNTDGRPMSAYYQRLKHQLLVTYRFLKGQRLR